MFGFRMFRIFDGKASIWEVVCCMCFAARSALVQNEQQVEQTYRKALLANVPVPHQRVFGIFSCPYANALLQSPKAAVRYDELTIQGIWNYQTGGHCPYKFDCGWSARVPGI